MELSAEMKKGITKEIEGTLQETTQFDFPFLAGTEEKKRILEQKRASVEQRLKAAAPEQFPCDNILEEMWKEAIGYADGQFAFLEEKSRLNGFYLQELMHCYAEKIGEHILEKA